MRKNDPGSKKDEKERFWKLERLIKHDPGSKKDAKVSS
jgi:hypothetical protein